jgi:D-alanyl-lipoteichoic acid acyltransferase DltB (MBOAT superfamily)
MDPESVKRGVVLFLGIVSAVLIADALSEMIVPLTRVTGAAASILHLLVYAGILFGVIYLLKRFAGIDIFRFGGD